MHDGSFKGSIRVLGFGLGVNLSYHNRDLQ